MWPAAILKAELAAQLVEVLEDGVVAFAVLREDSWVPSTCWGDVLDDALWDLRHVCQRAAGKPEDPEVHGEPQPIGGSTVTTNDFEVAG